MVKYLGVLVLVMAFATPVFAQDDYHQVEITLGYGNLGGTSFGPGRHSGFASHQAFNLNSWLGIENYLGYYSLGSDPNLGKINLLTNMFGGKFSYRGLGPVVYGTAGFGGGFLIFPQIGSGSNNAMATRLGVGVDIPIDESFSWKVDVSRMSFHFNGWNSATNISTGIVLKFSSF